MENSTNNQSGESSGEIIHRHLQQRAGAGTTGRPRLDGLPIELLRNISLGGVADSSPDSNGPVLDNDPLPPEDYLHYASTAKVFESALMGNLEYAQGQNSSGEFSESQRHFVNYLKELPLEDLMNIYSECVNSPTQFHQISRALLELAKEGHPLAEEIFTHLTRNQELDTDSLSEIQREPGVNDATRSNIRRHNNVSQPMLTEFIDATLAAPPPAPFGGPAFLPPGGPPPPPGARRMTTSAQIALNEIARLHTEGGQIRRILNAAHANNETLGEASKNPQIPLPLLHVIQGKLDHASQHVQKRLISNPQAKKEKAGAQALFLKIARDPITNDDTLAHLVSSRKLPQSGLQEISERLNRPLGMHHDALKHRQSLLRSLAKCSSEEKAMHESDAEIPILSSNQMNVEKILDNVINNDYCDAETLDLVIDSDHATNRNLWNAFHRIAKAKEKHIPEKDGRSRSSSPDSLHAGDRNLDNVAMNHQFRETLLLKIYKKDKADEALRGEIVSRASGFGFLKRAAMLAGSAKSLEKIFTPIKEEKVIAPEEWALDNRNEALIAILQNTAVTSELTAQIKIQFGGDKNISQAVEFARRRINQAAKGKVRKADELEPAGSPPHDDSKRTRLKRELER